MKKVLLIKPPFSFIPIGMGYVLAALDKAGIPVDFYDPTRPSHTASYYRDCLSDGGYLAVGTGGFAYGINWFRQLTAQIRAASSSTPIVLGGNITRNVGLNLLLNQLPIDFAIVGEAEESFPTLLKRLDSEESYEDIPGLAFKSKSDGRIVRNPSCRVRLDQEFFMPAYSYIDLQYYIDSYRHHVVPGLGRMMAVLTGRGCKGGCSFCSPTVGSFVPRNIDHILKEIEILNSQYEFEWITFATEIFFNSEDDIRAFCKAYETVSPMKPWSCCFRMDQSAEVLKVMKQAGCAMVNIGLESASQRVLSKLKKGCTVEGFKKTYNAAREAGIMVDSPFMMTNEDETEEDLKKTFDFLIENKIVANFGLVGTYPGTAIYQRALKKGLIGDEWEYITQRMLESAWRSPSVTETPYLNISAMPSSDVFRIVYEQVRRYFTFLFNEFQAKDVRLALYHDSTSGKMGLSGSCCRCGTPRVLPLSGNGVMHVIEYEFSCNQCHQRNYMNFMSLETTRAYYRRLGTELRRARKILVLGTDKNAQDFFLYDIFGIDMHRLIGFVEAREGAPERLFYHLPRFRLPDLDRIDYDALLITDFGPDLAKILLSTSKIAPTIPSFFLAPALSPAG